MHKWKSPALDKLPNFWLNILTSTHKVLTYTLSQTLKNPEEIPEWLAKDITYLLLKVRETNNPKNHRTIICLSTTYKLKQKNCYHMNTKDAERDHTDVKTSYLLTELLLETATRKKRSLSTAWIDYRKAFDSVFHADTKITGDL